MGLFEEVSREGGAVQTEKEGTHQQNIVHSHYCPIGSMGGLRWNHINQDTLWKTVPPLCSPNSKQLVVRDKLKTFWPLCKIRFPASPPASSFSSLVNGEVLPACLANANEKKWRLLGPSLFVFQLFLRHMSAFMSALRQNIKAPHSLLIFAMTAQSFRHTKFIACSCTFYFKKSGYTHY